MTNYSYLASHRSLFLGMTYLIQWWIVLIMLATDSFKFIRIVRSSLVFISVSYPLYPWQEFGIVILLPIWWLSKLLPSNILYQIDAIFSTVFDTLYVTFLKNLRISFLLYVLNPFEIVLNWNITEYDLLAYHLLLTPCKLVLTIEECVDQCQCSLLLTHPFWVSNRQ